MEEIKRLPRPKILFPNEHGAWGMFAVAFLAGWWTAPILSWRPLWILPAAFGAFLARYPLGLCFKKRRVARALKIDLSHEKRWLFIYSLFTLVVSEPLFFPLGWWWLLIFAALSSAALALNLWAIVRRKERTFFVELMATTGITFLAPAASYAAILRFHWGPILIWGVLFSYFAWRISAVRRAVARKKEAPIDLKSLGKKELFWSSVFVLTLVVAARVLYETLL